MADTRMTAQPSCTPSIREIRPEDDRALERIITDVMASFGAVGEGYSVMDPETRAMSSTYLQERARYYVVECDGRVVGGAGVAHLTDGPPDVCELRKMYFLPEIRGQGVGNRVLQMCLDAARELGYKTCYLETLTHMDTARAMYAKAGFKPLSAPMGNTGHNKCNTWYAMEL